MPNLLDSTPDELEWAAAHRVHTPSEARVMRPDAACLIPSIIDRLCRTRYGLCHAVHVGRTGVYATVLIPNEFDKYGLCNAILTVSTKSAAKLPGWPRRERLFTSHARHWSLSHTDRWDTFLTRFPVLARL